MNMQNHRQEGLSSSEKEGLSPHRAIALSIEPEDQTQLVRLAINTWGVDDAVVLDASFGVSPEKKSYVAVVAEYDTGENVTRDNKERSPSRQQLVQNWVNYFGHITCHETILQPYAKESSQLIALSRISSADRAKFMSLSAINGIRSRLLIKDDDLYIISRIAQVTRSYQSRKTDIPSAQTFAPPVHFQRAVILAPPTKK